MTSLLDIIFLKTSQFLAFQHGELPVPQKSKPSQLWGNFEIKEFLNDNWFYLGGILLMILLFVFYLRQNKKEKMEKEQNEKEIQ